jgi:hypothetical protein
MSIYFTHASRTQAERIAHELAAAQLDAQRADFARERAALFESFANDAVREHKRAEADMRYD